MQQPPIFIQGIQISEPMTTVTDLLVAGVCLYGYFQLNKINSASKVLWFLKYYLLLLSISTTLGGLLGHGFQHNLDFLWKLPGWFFGMYALLFMERASIEQVDKLLPEKYMRWLKFFNIAEIILFTAIVLYTLDFIFVGVHSVFALLFVVFPLQVFIYRKTRNPASRAFLIGIGWAFVAYLVFALKISLHVYFNSLDIAHVFMAIAAWWFYRGGCRLPVTSWGQESLRTFRVD